MAAYPFHAEAEGDLHADVDRAFTWLDDHRNLASHMDRPRSAMGGGQMHLDLDARGGHAVGSRMRLAGTFLGLSLDAETCVTQREPPRRKVWETVGDPRLLVIGRYRMGFELTQESAAGSRLRVFIDYALPQGPLAKLAARPIASMYARWCTSQMVRDAVRHRWDNQAPAPA